MSSGRQGHRLRPSVEHVEQEARAKRDPRADRVGDREREDPGPSLGGVVACRELVRGDLGVARVHLQDVPVQRPVGVERHAGHELHVVLFEQTDRRDELERGAGMRGDHLAQREQLVHRRVTRRHGLALVVVVRRRPRRREPHATRGEPLSEQALHLVLLAGRRMPARRILAHHDPPDRRVSDEEPRVHRELVLEPIEVLRRRRPVPRHALRERFEGHALDPCEHPHQVVAVLGAERRDREPAVASDHRGDAVQRRGRQRRVPERLRVVVRVDVDEARRDREARRIDGLFGRLGHLADRDDLTVPDADVGAAPRPPRSVDDLATSDHTVEHARTLRPPGWGEEGRATQASRRRASA